jgi:signal transduction histidine kinase
MMDTPEGVSPSGPASEEAEDPTAEKIRRLSDLLTAVRRMHSQIGGEIAETPDAEGGGVARHRETAEARLHEYRLQTSRNLEAIGALARGIAHDFNNIIGVILGNGELMRLEISEASVIRDDLEELLKAGYRARELVQRILPLARGSEAERRPAPVPSAAGNQHLLVDDEAAAVRTGK